VLRIDPLLHEALRTAARDAGLSLNDYCARKLGSPVVAADGLADGAQAVARATQLFGEHLVGLAVFGSWSRDETADTSDVDLLVVVDEDVGLTRALYRTWDQVPVTWSARQVEPHFVHVPDVAAVNGGIWAEAALDGIVLFERFRQVSSALAGIRHRIVAGRLVRRLVHGQPYWMEVAS
jgi:hypothetical protein